jgi:hypothetical protein
MPETARSSGRLTALTVIPGCFSNLVLRGIFACQPSNTGGSAMRDTTTLLPSLPSEQQARLVMWSCGVRDEWTTAEDTATDRGDRPTDTHGGAALPDAVRRNGGGCASAHAPALPFGEGGQAPPGDATAARLPCGDAPSAPSRAPGRRRASACAGGSHRAALIPLPLGEQEEHARRTVAGVRERRGRAVALVAVDVAMASTTGRVTPWCQTPEPRSVLAVSPRGLRPRCGGPS